VKIIVIGAGYVGLSNAVLLAQKNQVKLIDIDTNKILLLNQNKSPIKDSLIQKYLSTKKLSLSYDSELCSDLSSTDVIIIATPTNFNSKTKTFNTNIIESILFDLHQKKFSNLVIIRSTVPIGFTERIKKKYPNFELAFFPEFLREGEALKDSLYPTRIICGSKSRSAKNFLKILQKSSIKKNIKTLITSPTEAESIKLFSNMYLALRISFFNELDSFSVSKNLNSQEIIEGVSMDPRIGSYYNNPSFGYGGYCLPKDTKQLKENFKNIPQNLIQATIEANATRKKFITSEILKINAKTIGVYRISMKKGSDN
jgi:UDPglucose 6-dehydrogenase